MRAMKPESKRSLLRHELNVWILAFILVVGLGGWAFTAKISSAVIAPATVVVEGDVKKVQHLRGGIVSQVLVAENMHVNAGQVLIRLDGTSALANLSIDENTLAQLYVRQERLNAEAQDAPDFDASKDLMKLLIMQGADADQVAAQAAVTKTEKKLFFSRKIALESSLQQLESRQMQMKEQIKGTLAQISAAKMALTLIDEQLLSTQSLYKKQQETISHLNTLKRQRTDIESSLGEKVAAKAEAEGKYAEIGLQIVQVGEDRRSEISKDLADVEAKISEYEQRRIAQLDELNRLDVTAPLSGRIHELAVHTVNGVIEAGATLMLIVPDDEKLILDAKVSPRDIDHIHPGQQVDVRFSAFDQRTTPDIQAKIDSIAPDVVVDPRSGSSYYQVRVRPLAESLAKLKGLELTAGMPAEAFFKISERTAISYLAKPLTDQMKHVFREE